MGRIRVLFSPPILHCQSGFSLDKSYVPFSPSGELPDGYYESDLKSDADGLPIAVEDKSQFFSLAGDLNHDGVVDDDGISTFSLNYEGADGPYNYAQGDVDYNGTVDLDEFAIVGGNYGTYVHAPPTAANSLTISSAGADEKALYLTWTAPTGDSPDGYHVFRSTDGGINYSLYDTVVGESNTRTKTMTKIADGASIITAWGVHGRGRQFVDDE